MGPALLVLGVAVLGTGCCRYIELLTESKAGDPTPKVAIGTDDEEESNPPPARASAPAPLAPPGPPPPGPASFPAPPVGGLGSSGGGGEALDLTEVIRLATAIASTQEPQAVLMTALFSAARAGKIRLADGEATLSFQYRRRDASKPPGQDLVQGSIAVNARNGALHPYRMVGSASFLESYERAVNEGNPLSSVFRPLPVPACTSVRAWESAVQHGMPSEAVARWQLRSKFRQEGFLWAISVEGHDELARELDASTCAVLGGRVAPTHPVAPLPTLRPPVAPQSPPAARTPPRPPPAPAPRRPCNCPAGDLVCQMRDCAP